MDAYIKAILEKRIIAIVRGLESAQIIRLAQSLNDGGINVMEVTFNQKKPETWMDTRKAISSVAEKFKGIIHIGAGTVINEEQVRIAYDAGAEFIVSPNTDERVIRTAKDLGMVSLPGALTPTEIAFAHRCGADAVKVFPASVLGAGYIKAVRAPLSHIGLIAVGGVDEKNAPDFIRAGAVGIGVGGNLVNKSWINAGEYEKIASAAKEYVRAVNIV
jgi:2-dehydro-3-deoxyphosphogluconate aldolase/(4S)-4-hydroxy-2-oxoglutarate aldolase